jgi:hypothetical protein
VRICRNPRSIGESPVRAVVGGNDEVAAGVQVERARS